MRYLTLDQYAELPDEDDAYLIDHFIPIPGRVLLIGPPKVGKSYLALQIALAIAEGRPFLGRPSRAARVLYLQYDTPHQMWRNRLKLLKDSGISLGGEAFSVLEPDDARPSIDVLKQADVEYLLKIVQESTPEFVVIDCLRKIHSGDENDSGSMTKVFNILNIIFKSQSVLYVHHPHKLSPPPGMKHQGRISPVDAARGSSFIAGEVDAVYLLYGSRLSCDCRFDESVEYRADRDPVTKLWTFPETARVEKLETNLRDAFQARQWSNWSTFVQHVHHTFTAVPDHLLTRLQRELGPTLGAVESPGHNVPECPAVSDLSRAQSPQTSVLESRHE